MFSQTPALRATRAALVRGASVGGGARPPPRAHQRPRAGRRGGWGGVGERRAASGACAVWREAREPAPWLCSEGVGRRRMRPSCRGRGVVEERRLARTHAQPGGSGAGNVCVAGVRPGAEERSGTTEHAQVGPAGAGQEPSGCLCACAPRLALSHAAAPLGSRCAARAARAPRRPLATRHAPAGHGCRARRRGLRVGGPARAVSGAGVLCAAEGPAQRKREYPPPFPSALSPQARPLAAA